MSPAEIQLNSFPHYTWEPVNIFVRKPNFIRKRKILSKNFDENEFENVKTQNIRLLIQQTRTRMQLSQKDLAKIVNVHWTEVRDAETGNARVEPERFERICRALNIKNII